MNADTTRDRIRIAGNSGCKVEIVSYSQRVAVRKSTLSAGYAERLRKQRKKLESVDATKGICIPRVIEYDDTSFTMEYLHMLDAIEFFEIATPRDIGSRLDILFRFIRQNLERARPTAVSRDLFLEKLDAIQGAIPAQIWQEHYSDHTRRIRAALPDKMVVPIGQCHGDLTFSNVMFSIEDTRVGLIDFLDSFLESPIVDIVKLRQDTKFNWTSRRYSVAHDCPKILIVMSWIDGLLESAFSDTIRGLSFGIVEKMNYLRIAPYVRSDEEHRFLSDALRKTGIE